MMSTNLADVHTDSPKETRPIFQEISICLGALENGRRSGNSLWIERWTERIENIVRNELPSGSGFDSGTTLNFEKSTPNKLVFDTSFHHMNDVGIYDGWTEHSVIVTPDLSVGFDLRVTGRDRNEIKDYIADTFAYHLRYEIEWRAPMT